MARKRRGINYPPELEDLVRALARAAAREHWRAHLRRLEWKREEDELKQRLRESRKRKADEQMKKAHKSDSNGQSK